MSNIRHNCPVCGFAIWRPKEAEGELEQCPICSTRIVLREVVLPRLKDEAPDAFEDEEAGESKIEGAIEELQKYFETEQGIYQGWVPPVFSRKVGVAIGVLVILALSIGWIGWTEIEKRRWEEVDQILRRARTEVLGRRFDEALASFESAFALIQNDHAPGPDLESLIVHSRKEAEWIRGILEERHARLKEQIRLARIRVEVAGNAFVHDRTGAPQIPEGMEVLLVRGSVSASDLKGVMKQIRQGLGPDGENVSEKKEIDELLASSIATKVDLKKLLRWRALVPTEATATWFQPHDGWVMARSPVRSSGAFRLPAVKGGRYLLYAAFRSDRFDAEWWVPVFLRNEGAHSQHLNEENATHLRR